MPFQTWNADHDFTSKLDLMDDISEQPEMTQLKQFFFEQGSKAVFGLIIGKNCEVEYAVGDCLTFLGHQTNHVAPTSIMRFLSGIHRQLILSIMPSSFGYRNGNVQHLKITFTNERTKKNYNFELVSKLLLISQRQETEHGYHFFDNPTDYAPSWTVLTSKMALSYEQKHMEIIDKFKKLSSNDSDDWILSFWPKREKQKACVACVANKPENEANSPQEISLGIIVFYLDQTTFKVIKVDSSACLAAKFSETFFLGKSLKEFCRKNEWPTVDLILETAPRVEGSCAELTFIVDGRNVATRASMLRSFSADEPHQLRCEILKFFPELIHRSMSLACSETNTLTTLMPIITENCDETSRDGNNFVLNRTFSTPAEITIVSTKKGNSKKGRPSETQLSRIDSVIDSVANASAEVKNSESSVLKSMLEKSSEGFQNDVGWQVVSESEPYNSSNCFQPRLDFSNLDTKKKSQKASKPRKTTRKQSEEFKSVVEPQEMYPSGSYPPGFSGGQMLPPQYSQNISESRPSTMFNPNMPSSSRAGPMTSSASYMPPMGHPNLNQQMMYQQQQQQQISMQQHPQMQQMMAQNNGQQWSQQNPNMYHPQQMFYNQNGQRSIPSGFISQQQQQQQMQQQISQQTPPKKANKRKSVQRQQEQAPPPQLMQQHIQQQAATSQQMMGTQPPIKQQFLNPMNGFPNGSPQFNGANPSMNHLSPFHPNQQPGHYDWNKSVTTNVATQATNMPISRSEQIKSDLRATISNRQHSSPQQFGAMMSPNDLQQARFLAGPGTSISPPTMMSPPRPTNVPHPGHAANQAYGPSSISQPNSAQSDQTNLFSPKNGHLFNNNNNPNSLHLPGPMPPPQMINQNPIHPPFKSHLAEVSMIKEFPVLSLEDCKEVLQDPELIDFNFGGFDMISKQGYEFNFEESSKLVQRILPC